MWAGLQCDCAGTRPRLRQHPQQPRLFQNRYHHMTHGSVSILPLYTIFLYPENPGIIIICPCPLSPAPCTPRDLTTYVQCELSTSSVSWGSSDGAKTYTATATGVDGHVHLCHTNTTYCTWDDLHCGEEYTVVVRANGYNCSSRASNSTLISMSMYDIMKMLQLCWTCLSLQFLVNAFFKGKNSNY